MNIMETYTMKTISRKDIKLADYNPRKIDEETKKRLKKAMKKYGLVQPLIYNKRTGVLVSGHQRLSIMDEEAKGKDYKIQVAVIDVSPEDEKRLNVQLNNTSMMGMFDDDMLRDLADDIGTEDLGFSDAEIDLIFNDENFADEFTSKEEAGKSKGILKDIKEERKEMMEKKKADNSADFYFIVICDNEEQKDRLYKAMKIAIGEEFVPAFALESILSEKFRNTADKPGRLPKVEKE